MTVEPVSTLLSILFWLFLIDPFKRRTFKRNYFKLYQNKLFLIICLSISIILTLLPHIVLTLPMAFSTLPFWYILTSLLLVKATLNKKKLPFKFIQRYDLIKLNLKDFIFSTVLMIVPFVLAIITDIYTL
jgi:hypothetical protein